MATYQELTGLKSDPNLKAKIIPAISIKSKSVLDSGTSTAGQKSFVKDYYTQPENLIDSIIWPVLIANKNATVSQINSATDVAVQTAVDNAIDSIIEDL